MITYTCCNCKATFEVDATIEEADGATTYCNKCDTLLLIEGDHTLDFDKEMQKDYPGYSTSGSIIVP
jgi:hypothetical protein